MSTNDAGDAADSGAATAAAIAPSIASVGSAFYFDPATTAVGKEHGLDGFRLYFLGRGGPLGDVEGQVVASAFGYFNPALVTTMWDTARAKVAPRDAGRLYLECAHEFGRARFADIDGLDEFIAAAEAVDDAIDPTGLTLYAAISAEPKPDDAAARAMHMAVRLREARGSLHLLALVANGLDSKLAHRISRPGDYEMFGWKDDPEVTGEDVELRNQAEVLTNDLMGRACDVLDESGRTALVDGAQRMAAAL